METGEGTEPEADGEIDVPGMVVLFDCVTGDPSVLLLLLTPVEYSPVRDSEVKLAVGAVPGAEDVMLPAGMVPVEKRLDLVPLDVVAGEDGTDV